MAETKTKENLVGHQLFSYAELETAWNKLKSNVENDPYDRDHPPSGGYDIRNGYSRDAEGRDWIYWDMEFSLEGIVKELERVPETIGYGCLEVYYNNSEINQADLDDHGIFIKNGKIKQVY